MVTSRILRLSFFFMSVMAILLARPEIACSQLTILHSFGSLNDGYDPRSDLVVSGTTLYGTTGASFPSGRGSIFRIDGNGDNYATVHTFSSDGSEGVNPQNKLAVSGSVLYGTAGRGSPANDGTLFRVNADGTNFEILHNFAPSPTGGSLSLAGVTISGSTLYGMKQLGGAYDDGLLYGFDMSGPGYSTLHSFQHLFDGSGPWGDVVTDGSSLYGLTTLGFESLFRCNMDGSGYTVLHSFQSGGSNAWGTYGSPTIAGTKIYGMTHNGGTYDLGTVFSVNTDGSDFSILHSFSGFPNDGYRPLGDVLVSGSTIYGMTEVGGLYDRGTIFEIDINGAGFSLLHSFSGGAADGDYPQGSLTQIGSLLYGTTVFGGFNNLGTVFSFAVPEPSSATLFAVFIAIPICRRRRRKVA